MSDLLLVLQSFGALPWFQTLVVAAIAIAFWEGSRRLLQLYVVKSFQSTAKILTDQINQHEGLLADHGARLERLRADLSLTTGQARKALSLCDEMRERSRA